MNIRGEYPLELGVVSFHGKNALNRKLVVDPAEATDAQRCIPSEVQVFRSGQASLHSIQT